MNTLLLIVALGLLSVALVYAVACIRRDASRSDLVSACNTLAPSFGTHVNAITLLATAAVGTRYFLGKRGADVSHVAVVAAAADEPLCVLTDEADAAEDPIDCELLAITNRTVPMVAGAVIGLDLAVYSSGDGKVIVKPTAAGTYWKVGIARQAATADGDVIEVEPCKPRKLVVIAALGNANGAIAAINSTAVNPTKADFDLLLAACEKLADDVRAIATGLSADADITLATS